MSNILLTQQNIEYLLSPAFLKPNLVILNLSKRERERKREWVDSDRQEV